jgi:hypothetical protein
VNYKQQLILELDDVDDALVTEVLDFLQFLKTKQIEDREDIADSRRALATVSIDGTVSWEALKAEVGL